MYNRKLRVCYKKDWFLEKKLLKNITCLARVALISQNVKLLYSCRLFQNDVTQSMLLFFKTSGNFCRAHSVKVWFGSSAHNLRFFLFTILDSVFLNRRSAALSVDFDFPRICVKYSLKIESRSLRSKRDLVQDRKQMFL